MKKFWFKSSLLFISILALGLAYVNTAMITANDIEGDTEVDGVLNTQNFNNRAVIDGYKLESIASNGTATIENSGATLIPQQVYRISIIVRDPDTIRDLRSFEVRFYNSDATTESALIADFNSANAIDTDGQQFVVRWDRAETDPVSDPFYMVTASGVTLGGITWELVKANVHPTTNSHLNGTSFEFSFDFKISKVAPRFTSDDAARWYVGAIIEDGFVSLNNKGVDESAIVQHALKSKLDTDTNSLSNGASAYIMAFYGEVSIGASSIEWSDIPAGITFGSVNADENIVDIQYIANGTFVSEIKSSPVWNAVMTSTLANNLFAAVTSTDWGNFSTEYGNIFNGSKTIAAPNDMAGLTFDQINTVADAISTGFWATFKVELPAFDTVNTNRTGANLVNLVNDPSGLSGTAIITPSFIHLLDNSIEQYFAIAYKVHSLADVDFVYSVKADLTEETTDPENLVYALVGHSEFRPFIQSAGASRIKTREAGTLFDLTLYVALSDTFQNARYEGKITLNVKNAQ